VTEATQQRQEADAAVEQAQAALTRFRGLKAILDRPPMTFDRDQRFDGCCCWAPSGEEGEIAIGDTGGRTG
jgi:hypothetical protein